MSVTVKNESTGLVALPRPFVKTLAAGASATVTGIGLDGVDSGPRTKLQALANAGKITITETDETLARGTPNDASVADVHQVLAVGQGTAGAASVEAVQYVERPSYLQEVTCYFDSVPAAGESITVDLKRNGLSILNASLVVDQTSTLPSASAVLRPNDVDNTDGVVAVADPDKFTSAGAAFADNDIGSLIYLNSGGSNDGVYIIGSRIDANNVNLLNLDGTAAAFTDESGIEWDMLLSLQVGDILSLTGTVAGVTNLNYWACNAIIVPR